LSLFPPNRNGWAAWAQGEFRFPCEQDLKKQGQSGSDVPAPREALYSRMRERGNGTDGLPRRSKGASGHLQSDVGIAAAFFKRNSHCY